MNSLFFDFRLNIFSGINEKKPRRFDLDFDFDFNLIKLISISLTRRKLIKKE